MCIYDNSITLMLCAFYASIQTNKKAIDITEMLWYYIITEGANESESRKPCKVLKPLYDRWLRGAERIHGYLTSQSTKQLDN